MYVQKNVYLKYKMICVITSQSLAARFSSCKTDYGIIVQRGALNYLTF